MGLFRRRRDEGAGAAQLDEALPSLRVEQAQRLVLLARTAFAEGGIETTYDGNGALARDDGGFFGLYNLSVQCARAPERQWPRLVRAHVAAMLSIDSDEPLVLDEVRDRLYLKLTHTAELPFDPPVYAPQIAPDLYALVAVDHPTHVATQGRDESLDPLGGFDAVRDLCLGNLRRLRATQVDTLRADPERPDSDIHLLVGDFYAASRLIVLDDVLRDELGIERPSHGTLVAVPHRHLLAVHVLQGEGTRAATGVLADLARGEHAGSAGPVSPHVYYARSGQIQQVTMLDDDGTTEIRVHGLLADAFAALGLLGDPGDL